MNKKLVIREVWLLDEDGNRLMEIVPFNLPVADDMSRVTGGYGYGYDKSYMGYLTRKMQRYIKSK